MRRSLRFGVALACLVSLSILAACGDGGQAEPAAGAVPSEAQASKARKLFQDEGCPMCHGEMTQGVEGLGPPLRDLAPYWDRDRLTAYLADPEAFRAAHPDFEDRRDETFGIEMPPYDYLSDEQRQLLADWLLTR